MTYKPRRKVRTRPGRVITLTLAAVVVFVAVFLATFAALTKWG